MNEEENEKHEFNFFLDRQIQQKLFDADEEAIAKESQNINILSKKLKGSNGSISSSTPLIKINTGTHGVKQSIKELHNISLCGWISDPSKVYRKSENENSTKSRSSTVASHREFLSSRGDSKNRQGLSQDFVFRHYTDPRKYIEQYRRAHVCYDTATSSATKNEFLDKNRFYAYHQYSSLPVNITAQNNSPYQNGPVHHNGSPHQNHSQSYQTEQSPQYSESTKTQYSSSNPYTNKRDSQKQTLVANLRPNQQHIYKLEKSILQKQDSEKSITSGSDGPEGLERKRSGSAKDRINPTVNGVSVQVHKSMATKVNVPSSAGFSGSRLHRSAIPSGSPLDATPAATNQFHAHKLGQATSPGARTLDTLACVAGGGDKQVTIPPASPFMSLTSLSCRLYNRKLKQALHSQLLLPPIHRASTLARKIN